MRRECLLLHECCAEMVFYDLVGCGIHEAVHVAVVNRQQEILERSVFLYGLSKSTCWSWVLLPVYP
jgi:uncharacterized protein YcfL